MGLSIAWPWTQQTGRIIGTFALLQRQSEHLRTEGLSVRQTQLFKVCEVVASVLWSVVLARAPTDGAILATRYGTSLERLSNRYAPYSTVGLLFQCSA